MLKVVIGHSEDPDSICAVKEVLQQCEEDLMDMAPTAGNLIEYGDFKCDLHSKTSNQRYLGNRLPTAENPLAVYVRDNENYYMRVPNSCNDDGSINFLANIPEQASVRVTDSSRDEIIAASLNSFKTALQNYPGNKLDAVLIFSCCCRRWLLGTRSKKEYQLIQNALPCEAPLSGFYTYGEFAPLEPQGATYFHQETFITLLLGTQ